MNASFPKVSWLPGSPRQQWCQLPAARCTESDSLALCSRSGPVSMCVHIGWDWKSGEQAGSGWLHTSPPSCSTGLGGKVSIYGAKPRFCLSMMCCHVCCISTNFGKIAVMHSGVWNTSCSTRQTPDCVTTRDTLPSIMLWLVVIRQVWSSFWHLLVHISVLAVMTCPRWRLCI